MSTIVLDRKSVRIPGWVQDLESFRRWVDSEGFSEEVRVCYLNDEVWMDMSHEQLFTHVKVKDEFTLGLLGVAKAAQLGEYFGDGVLLTNVAADFSSGPDGVFVSEVALASGRARFVEGRTEGYVELEGTPDMVLEVVSTSSVEKDTVTLRDLYWQAGIAEYWIVDARGDQTSFDMLRYNARGYVPVRRQGGWLKSIVFGRSFRLSRQPDKRGNPQHTLEVR